MVDMAPTPYVHFAVGLQWPGVIGLLLSCRTLLTFQEWPYLHQARFGRLPVRGCPGSKSTAHDHSVSVNRAVDSPGVRPDFVVTSTNRAIIIDVTVPLSSAEGLEYARDKKIEKYKHLGSVLPLVVGSLGSWLSSNDAISLALSLPGRQWNNLNWKMKLLAIQGTTKVIAIHLASQTEESYPPPEEDEEAVDISPLQLKLHSLPFATLVLPHFNCTVSETQGIATNSTKEEPTMALKIAESGLVHHGGSTGVISKPTKEESEMA
ncbi:uncharacterized protein LOC130703070 [Daphnia carinata]|uniref:uncharacterized protein LOC130703070 n=1 Tax=Daphnia carinata TaxID=120202 RepID=UPI0025796E0A|nr:uncharacterized protein LOC130703070 [Daphnia carinata]